ncbi:pyridoxal phosphate-dependent transferase [Immersiella caudata]|uniref:Pyridoxal phosphate-dependent transferase n=1 Tax=Immersiella caudata TaxID=314043 RepID=A0AA39WLC9_9PEZI|nr:pyridoxal phosphate-dependent transferase [Immersiella caudata]
MLNKLAMGEANQLSSRMRDTIVSIAANIDKTMANRVSCIDLATAENWLIRPELQEIYQAAISSGISSKNLSYPDSLAGDLELRESLALLFTRYFSPHRPVQASQVVATPGATHCLDALLTTICNEGDSILVPVPYWSGFALHFHLRARVNIVPVRLEWDPAAGPLDETSRPLERSLLGALEAAFAGVEDKSTVKALVVTNPNNPLGQCYPACVLRECLQFCRERDMHYVSDELYALSHFGAGHAGVKGHAFVSALALVGPSRSGLGNRSEVPPGRKKRTRMENDEDEDGRDMKVGPAGKRRRIGQLGGNDEAHMVDVCSPLVNGTEAEDDENSNGIMVSRGRDGEVVKLKASDEADEEDDDMDTAKVHVIWSTSKDLCSSGLRMAALVSQAPRSALILKSVALLSGMHLSSLSALATRRLLQSSRFPGLLSQLSSRLARAHEMAATRFRRWGVPFIVADAGPFVMVRLGAGRDEAGILRRLAQVGVMVAPGRTFGGSGWCEGDGGFWARVTVAVPPETLWDGLQTMEFALGF